MLTLLSYIGLLFLALIITLVIYIGLAKIAKLL